MTSYAGAWAAHPPAFERLTPHRVGPNAVIQLAAALRAGPGENVARTVFARSGFARLLDAMPTEMVDQAIVHRLFSTLYCVLSEDAARAVAADAGRRTADYIVANRIPSFAKTTLRVLPARLSAPLLLQAIKKNAWTFAGSGRVRVFARPSPVIEIARNPLAMPGCVWHVAVFERLFRSLVSDTAAVTQVGCCLPGPGACRFTIRIHPDSEYPEKDGI